MPKKNLLPLVLLICCSANAATIDRVNRIGFEPLAPGQVTAESGRFVDTDGSGSYVDIQNHDTGSTIEIHLAEGDDYSPWFNVRWVFDEPSWARLTAESEFEIAPGPPPTGPLAFNPFIFSGDIALQGDWVVPPRTWLYGIAAALKDRCFANDVECQSSGSWTFAYSIEVIEAPLPGDIDLSGEVDFDDFLIMSRNWRRGRHWLQGDLTDDGFLDFDDFTVLSANFGRKQEVEGVAAVPEPLNQVLIAIILVCFATLRPRRTFTS